MYQFTMSSIMVVLFFNWSFLSTINTEMIPMCETLKDVKEDEDISLLRLRRVHALCDVMQSSRGIAEKEDSNLIPDFDLTLIGSENEANQILKRFRRGRSSSSGGGRSSGSSSRSSSSGSRWSSSSSGRSSRFFSRSSSSSSGSGGLSGTSGSKPSFSDKIRKITHSSGSSGSGFGTGGSNSGGGGNVWVRTGKKFLPHAVRFGKRYYQRRKYNKGMYAGVGAGTGYHAGSQINHYGQYYPYDNYGYPPTVNNPPDQINGKTPTVFYCIQEDLNTTLVNQTLNAEGFGLCNISGQLLTCPIEIECKTSEADNCCEDEYDTPYCCGGPIPEEYASQYGGYEDDWNDATESINEMLNIFTAICIMMGTICFTIWQRRE